jgi:hypothetical protein
VIAPAEPVVSCANCGRAFDGRFCPACGQAVEELRRPFQDLAREFLRELLGLDARLWRTLVTLFRRPGQLTVDTIEGRRARYVAPLRLYVFAGFVYFTVVALGGGGPFQPRISVGDEGVLVGFGGPRGESIGESPETPVDAEVTLPDSVSGIERRAREAARDPRAYSRAVYGTLSYVHFLLLPVLAGLLEVFYRGRWYAEHLVFGMHFQSFALLPSALIAAVFGFVPGLDSQGLAARAVTSAWWLILAAYLYLAMRRVYGGGRRRTLLKLAGFGLLYAWFAGVVVGVVAFLTVWFYRGPA